MESKSLVPVNGLFSIIHIAAGSIEMVVLIYIYLYACVSLLASEFVLSVCQIRALA